MARRIMRALKILEISGCDRPAQEPAKVAIIKRDAPVADGVAKGGVATDLGRLGDKLERHYQDYRRSWPERSETDARGAAWRRLSIADRNLLLESELGTFKAENVDLGALAQICLEGRAVALQKSQPELTREKAFSTACETEPWLFKLTRDARRKRLAAGNSEQRTVALGKRNDAY